MRTFPETIVPQEPRRDGIPEEPEEKDRPLHDGATLSAKAIAEAKAREALLKTIADGAKRAAGKCS